MRTLGPRNSAVLLAQRGALPLLSCVIPLGLGCFGCGSSTPGSEGSSGSSASGVGGSSGSAVAGSTASGGSMLPTAGSSGSVGQGGALPSTGGTTSSAGTGGIVASSSGAGGTGGAGAGGGGMAGAVAVGNGCVGVTAKFCEDFEKQTSGAAPMGDFKVSANAGAMVVDGSKPHGGKQSLHIKMGKPGARAMLDFTKQFPFNDQFGRAMMYITAIPTNDTHWDLVYSYSTAEWELGGQNGIFAFVIDPPDHEVNSKKNPIPTGKWFCLQWEFKYAGANADNTYSAKVDGVALDKGEWTGADPSGMKWVAGPWKNLSVG